jgi:Flp pilus assembly protein TadD
LPEHTGHTINNRGSANNLSVIVNQKLAITGHTLCQIVTGKEIAVRHLASEFLVSTAFGKMGEVSNRSSLFKMAASSLLMASALSSCSGVGLSKHASNEGAKATQKASSDASAVEKALAQKDATKAISAAEAAVAADSANPRYRALLGRAYLLGGRYTSAQTAFEDAMTLGNREPRTIVSLALVKIGQGQTNSARDLLFSNIEVLPAADYGLGMAMAGDTNEAIRVLSQAVQDPGAGPKERQNLAYSYALAGNWNEARAMASRDLDPSEAAKRVLGWASTAQQGAETERVVALLGVKPNLDDAGVPAALALNGDMARSAQMAASAPAYQPYSAPQADASQTYPHYYEAQTSAASITRDPILEYAPVPPVAKRTTTNARKPSIASAHSVTVSARKPAAKSAPMQMAIAKPAPVKPVSAKPTAVKQATKLALDKPVKAKSVAASQAKPAKLALAKPAMKSGKPIATYAKVALKQSVSKRKNDNWVVQLGAYSNSNGPDARYVRASLRKAAVGHGSLVSSTVKVGGKTYQRLSVAGFDSVRSANAACAAIRARGSACFVRASGPVQSTSKIWAAAPKSKKPSAVAMAKQMKVAKPKQQIAVRQSGDFIIEEVGKSSSTNRKLASRD